MYAIIKTDKLYLGNFRYIKDGYTILKSVNCWSKHDKLFFGECIYSNHSLKGQTHAFFYNHVNGPKLYDNLDELMSENFIELL